jgi:hypothetical protein
MSNTADTKGYHQAQSCSTMSLQVYLNIFILSPPLSPDRCFQIGSLLPHHTRLLSILQPCKSHHASHIACLEYITKFLLMLVENTARKTLWYFYLLWYQILSTYTIWVFVHKTHNNISQFWGESTKISPTSLNMLCFKMICRYQCPDICNCQAVPLVLPPLYIS